MSTQVASQQKDGQCAWNAFGRQSRYKPSISLTKVNGWWWQQPKLGPWEEFYRLIWLVAVLGIIMKSLKKISKKYIAFCHVTDSTSVLLMLTIVKWFFRFYIFARGWNVSTQVASQQNDSQCASVCEIHFVRQGRYKHNISLTKVNEWWWLYPKLGTVTRVLHIDLVGCCARKW